MQLLLQEPLGPKTTLGVGGVADYYALPVDFLSLQALLSDLWARKIPLYLLGRGSNVLVSDAGFRGCVIQLQGAFWTQCNFISDSQVRVGPGLRLKAFCAQVAKRGWSGFEFLEGIPGGIGGALAMNAGAMGSWIHAHLEWVQTLDYDGTARTWTAEELAAGYRSCPALKSRVVTAAQCLRPAQASAESIAATMAAMALQRKNSQPQGASAGCIFKNPGPGRLGAGALIDSLGLKGFSLGGATISEKHANFIVTRPGARCEDVLALIAHVQAAVLQYHGVELELEVQRLGE